MMRLVRRNKLNNAKAKVNQNEIVDLNHASCVDKIGEREKNQIESGNPTQVIGVCVCVNWIRFAEREGNGANKNKALDFGERNIGWTKLKVSHFRFLFFNKSRLY